MPRAALKKDARLAAYFSSEPERRAVTRELFDSAASGYDQAEFLTGLGSGPWYRREVLRRSGLRPGMQVLDVAAGTGLVTAEARAMVGEHGQVVALDPSPGMLAELRRKLPVDALVAYAEEIPLPEASMDFISMGYALRHVGDLDRAFAEIARVLRPGGRVCVMEISRPASRLGRILLRSYIGGVVPLLARLTGSHRRVGQLWEYYGDTIEAALDPEDILSALHRAGLSDAACSVTFGIFREYTARKS